MARTFWSADTPRFMRIRCVCRRACWSLLVPCSKAAATRPTFLKFETSLAGAGEDQVLLGIAECGLHGLVVELLDLVPKVSRNMLQTMLTLLGARR